MPQIPVSVSTATSHPTQSPLPPLFSTPGGLALLELQATIHGQPDMPVAKLQFPLLDPSSPDDAAWMKKVYLYVGAHQRLTGEVKKLPKPLGVVRRKEQGVGEQLECIDIVKYKIVFTQRPEPVGAAN